jgi:hypothetical protein
MATHVSAAPDAMEFWRQRLPLTGGENLVSEIHTDRLRPSNGTRPGLHRGQVGRAARCVTGR